jgi:hypothetical protein
MTWMGCTQSSSQPQPTNQPIFKTDGTPLLSILKSSSESGTKPCPPRSRRKVRFNVVTEEKKTVPEINDVDFFNTILQPGQKPSLAFARFSLPFSQNLVID